MGYVLNELANLPINENIKFYIFAINGQYRDPLYDMIQTNFFKIAESIGSSAAITVGTNPQNFTTSVARKILGRNSSDPSFLKILPALLITNAHPDNLTEDSLRLVIPLKDAKERIGEGHEFLALLAQFVRGESDEFIRRFEAQPNFLDAANKVVLLKPTIFGFGININHLIDVWNKRKGMSKQA